VTNVTHSAAQEAARQEAARQEAARIEAAREAERQEAARQAAAQLQAQRQEAAHQEAARIEAARQEAERQEAARQDAARQATARQEAARVQAEQAEARREERLRAIGRQLDEEAARREAASTADRQPNLLPRSLSTARRIKLFGRAHPNVELIQYAEAWAQKIQFNTGVETVREVAKRPHRDPLVTVAIRSDGSVESVTFEVSSGVAEVDDAIRRIVEGQRPYVAFPHALAREYDVVEIRRTWRFDTAIRLD
jgi:outer membrane biosynthesis protein TonB